MHQHYSAARIDSDNYRLLQEHVYTHAGIVLEGDKHYLFESRLAPIVRKLGLTSINELCALLASTPNSSIGRQIVEAMTTNETYFFRDSAQYEAVRTALLPRIRKQYDTRKLQVWSAAASSGQEAYSLAMLLLEEGFTHNNVHILGTDISSQVLERARAGKYQQIEVDRGLPASLLLRYFYCSGADWQLRDPVRCMVRYETMDLRRRKHDLGPFDLVFCRNVLIYFDQITRLNILQGIHRTLFRGGWLLLGGSEAGLGTEDWFERHTIGDATVYIAR